MPCGLSPAPSSATSAEAPTPHVYIIEGCGQHTDTKLTTLIYNELTFMAQVYYRECKTLMGKNITLPHTNSTQDSPTFPLTVSQALALYPWVQTK